MTVRTAVFMLVIALGFAGTVDAAGVVNGDFETGSLAPWSLSFTAGGATASVVGSSFAPNTNNNLNRRYAGNFSAALYSGSGQLDHLDFASISQDVFVDPSTVNLQFNVAAVLNGAHSTTPTEDAYFEIAVLNGATVLQSTRYYYANSPAPLVDDGVSGWRHLPWTSVTLSLAAYVGTTVTVKFATHDCKWGGHYAYAYVDGFALIPTPSPTFTVSPTVTTTPTISPSHTITPSFSITPTFSFSPTVTPTYTATPSATPTPTYTITQSHTISPTFTITNTFTASPTVTPTWTETPPPLLLSPKPANPNPGRDAVWLPYVLSTEAEVDIAIYDVAGEKVRSFDPVPKVRGAHEQRWDLSNQAGRKVASGVFLYRIRARSPRDETQEVWQKCAVSR